MSNLLLEPNEVEIVLPDETVLEARVLNPNLSGMDIDAFVAMHTAAWKSLPPINGNTLLENIEKGLIAGGYFNGKPAVLLRTAGLYVPELDQIAIVEDISPREKVYGALSHIPQTYDLLTANGRWRSIPHNANMAGLIDITRAEEFETHEVARGLIVYYSAVFINGVNGFQRQDPLKGVKMDFTLTPKPEDYDGDFINYNKRIIKWHRENGAHNSGYVFRSARPGQDAIAMFYSAPGFRAELPLGTVVNDNRIILPKKNAT